RADRRRLRTLALDLPLLAATATAAMLALWPALLVDPSGTALQVIQFGEVTGGAVHELGVFYLGHKVDDPGPGFYALGLAFRLSPSIVAGLVRWGVQRGWAARRRVGAADPALLLALGAVLVVAVLGVAAKKQDRYVLPAVPLLGV